MSKEEDYMRDLLSKRGLGNLNFELWINPPRVYVMGQTKEIEVWDEANKKWNITDIKLNPKRYGAIAVPRHIVC